MMKTIQYGTESRTDSPDSIPWTVRLLNRPRSMRCRK
jgi:hypothetical protein